MSARRRPTTSCAAAALGVAICVGASPAARAQSQADLAQMMETMKRLEARVTALEGENRQANKGAQAARAEAQAAHAEAQALRQRLGRAAPAANAAAAAGVAVPPHGVVSSGAAAMASAAAVPPDGYAMATKALPLAPVPGWSGLYAGAAFGIGWMRGRADESSVENLAELFRDTTLTQTIGETLASSSSLSGRDPGAMVNLFLGYNFLATDKVILGGQIEGGLSSIRVTVSGAGSNVINETIINTPPGGAAGTTSSTTTQSSNTTDIPDNRWTVSVLGRAGVLVDPADLVYALGGYTYGRFEAFGTGFGLNGATIGAGWEREIVAGWKLRGEYRYTKFQSTDVTQTFVTNSTTVSATASTTNTNVTSQTDHISADMHSLWLGMVYDFGN